MADAIWRNLERIRDSHLLLAVCFSRSDWDRGLWSLPCTFSPMAPGTLGDSLGPGVLSTASRNEMRIAIQQTEPDFPVGGHGRRCAGSTVSPTRGLSACRIIRAKS